MKKQFLQQKWLSIAFLIPALVLSFSTLNLNAKPTPFNESSTPLHLEFLPNFATGTSSWTLDATVDNVECYYKISTCNGGSTIFLKFNNKNSYPVKITWTEVFKTQIENNLSGILGEKSLVLAPGETADLDCNSGESVLLVRTHNISATYPAVVSNFGFANIKVINP